MRFHGVVVWVTCIAASFLSGCGGSTETEGESGDGGIDGSHLDSAVHDATRDTKSDRRIVTDAASKTESDGGDAAVGTESDGTVDTDAPAEGESDGAAVPDTSADTLSDGTAVPDTSADTLSDGTAVPDTSADAVSDGTAVPDASADTLSDGAAVPDASVDAALDGTAVADASVDVQGESSAVDGTVQDVATQEAGPPNDAAGDALDAGTCTLSPLSATPFPPLSGSAYVTGTEATPTGAVTGAFQNCAALVTHASSGVLTFSFNATGCSISYVDGSGGGFSSTINTSSLFGSQNAPNTAIAFDGDTYTCSFSDNGGDLIGPECPGMPGEGITATGSLFLLFERSTGAVSLSRDCEDLGVTQFCEPAFPTNTPTSESNLGGYLSCAVIDGGP